VLPEGAFGLGYKDFGIRSANGPRQILRKTPAQTVSPVSVAESTFREVWVGATFQLAGILAPIDGLIRKLTSN
jgi:hypothetical protein